MTRFLALAAVVALGLMSSSAQAAMILFSTGDTGNISFSTTEPLSGQVAFSDARLTVNSISISLGGFNWSCAGIACNSIGDAGTAPNTGTAIPFAVFDSNGELTGLRVQNWVTAGARLGLGVSSGFYREIPDPGYATNFTYTIAAVPEPGAALVFAVGMTIAGRTVRRRPA